MPVEMRLVAEVGCPCCPVILFAFMIRASRLEDGDQGNASAATPSAIGRAAEASDLTLPI